MDPAAYLPGMRRGRRARNLAVGAVYLALLPFVFVWLLSFTGYVLVTSRFGWPEFGGPGGGTGSGTSLNPLITEVVMLAVAVVAAAIVCGAFVTGFVTLPMADVPQASFSFAQAGPHAVEITHEAGGQLDAARVTVHVDGDAADGSWQPTPVRTGSHYRVTGLTGGETIRVVYTDAGGKSAVLATHEYEGG